MSLSFEKMKKPELLEVAEEFGVEVDKGMTVPFIISEIRDMGVTEAMWLASQGEVEDEEVPEEEPEELAKPTLPKARGRQEATVLIKMERENPTYETHGYRFTREHPYCVVRASDVDELIMNEYGFRQATPRELQEYYS